MQWPIRTDDIRDNNVNIAQAARRQFAPIQKPPKRGCILLYIAHPRLKESTINAYNQPKQHRIIGCCAYSDAMSIRFC